MGGNLHYKADVLKYESQLNKTLSPTEIWYFSLFIYLKTLSWKKEKTWKQKYSCDPLVKNVPNPDWRFSILFKQTKLNTA